MVKYIIKRILLSLLILVGVSFLIYLLVMLMPQDYIDNMVAPALQSGSMTLEEVDRLKQLYGLADKSLPGIASGYFNWAKSALTGDLGWSFLYARPVTDVIGQYVWISFAISAIGYVLQLLISIPMGVKAAVHQYSGYDYTVSVFAMAATSLPSFFLAALLMNVLSVRLGILPLQGLTSATKMFGEGQGFAKLMDQAWHLILPIMTLTLLSIGGLMRYTRTNMLEVLNSDYIRTARAKGLSERKVIYKHAFRNTMIPLVTTLSGMLPGLFSGAMITETVFAIPGIGNQAYRATIQGDVPFVMGYNMFLAILTVTGMLISDLMYVVVDPRVKITK